MASGDNLAQLAALAQIAAMSTEMNLNNQQQKFKRVQMDKQNQQWEREHALKEEQNAFNEEMKRAELNQTERAYWDQHGGNVKEDEFGNKYVDFDNYDHSLTPGFDKFTAEEDYSNVEEFLSKKPHMRVFMKEGDSEHNKKMIGEYSAGELGGATVANNFLINPKYYIDPETAQYTGTDLYSVNYLGKNDLEQAERYVSNLWNKTEEDLTPEDMEVLKDLNLYDGTEQWNPEVAQARWEGYKVGVLSNEEYLTGKEADEKKKSLENHLINFEASFLNSDLGKLVFQEYNQNLQQLKPGRNEESGELINVKTAFVKEVGGTSTKELDITNNKKLDRHFKKVLGENRYDDVLLYYQAKATGAFDSGFVDAYVKSLNATGEMLSGSDLERLGVQMKGLGRNAEFHEFKTLVMQRQSILNGVKRQSELLQNPQHMGQMMDKRNMMHALLSTSSVITGGTEDNPTTTAFRRFIVDPDVDGGQKRTEILKLRKRWIDAGQDGKIFDDYMRMFGTYTPALKTLTQQF